MRVLIVEDEPVIALEMESIVLDCLPSADVVIAGSVSDALRAVDDRLKLAFLDIDVTDGKTYPLALELKARRIPFVFVSGANSEETPAELVDAGFVSKPFSPAELHLKIDSLKIA